jgi:hydroxymethylpyrimidine pyrophosphatase-like HAD family hydrolase
MALCDAAEMDTAAIVNDYQVVSDKTYIDRYKLSIDYDTVYVDYDDTITCNKGEDINPYVMAFLYQCLNKNRSLILLTRHTLDKGNDLREDMHRRAISEEMFTEIHDISWNEEKADFIKSKKAIFLDNSFAERKKVHDKVGIAVFDISNIDCLFDWR